MGFVEDALAGEANPLSFDGKRVAAAAAVAAAVLAVALLIGNPFAQAEDTFAVYAENASQNQSAGEGAEGQTSEAAEALIHVHVAGCVLNPGVYELAEGSLADDALRAAGGPTPDALTESVNLARTLNDGEQLIIPAIQAQSAPEQQEAGAIPSQAMPAAQGNASAVSINNADASQLATLPGIGESTAKKIIAYRDTNGPFEKLEDLKNVSGIGDKKFEALQGLISL